jgi:hypothetical protein
MPESIETTWPTETEAAAALAISVKSVQRYVTKGLIEIRKRPRTGRKPENICNPSDVSKLLPTAHVVQAVGLARVSAPERTLRQAHLAPFGADLMAMIRTISHELETDKKEREIVATRPPKLWMTLKEAVEYSGLSRLDLLEVCKESLRRDRLADQVSEGRSKPQLIVRKSNGWKILRRSLQAFEG